MEWLPLIGLAKTFRDLPERLQQTFIQLMTMSAADFLDQWFETEPLKATMSASGIIGTYQGPRSPGTAYVLLHHYMGEIDGAFRAWGIPKGGTGGVTTRSHRRRCPSACEIRTEAPVARIDTKDGRATGVTLETGEEIEAGVVLSSARLEPDVPEAARAGRRSSRSSRTRSGATSTAAPVGQGEPGAGRAPRAGVQARGRASGSAARSASAPSARLHGAGLRRREVRQVPAAAPTST